MSCVHSVINGNEGIIDTIQDQIITSLCFDQLTEFIVMASNKTTTYTSIKCNYVVAVLVPSDITRSHDDGQGPNNTVPRIEDLVFDHVYHNLGQGQVQGMGHYSCDLWPPNQTNLWD